MTEQTRPASTAMKPFVGGLILGLLVGGLGGAYLGGYAETTVPKLRSPTPKPTTPSNPREERPGDGAPTGPVTPTPASEPAVAPEQPK